MINIDQIQLRDLIVALIVIGTITPMAISVLIWAINKRVKSIDEFISVTSDTLTELKIITQVHETEIETLKEDHRSLIVKYPKHR